MSLGFPLSQLLAKAEGDILVREKPVEEKESPEEEKEEVLDEPVGSGKS